MYPTYYQTKQVEAGDRLANIVATIVIAAVLLVSYGVTGNADYADELVREQATADRACRAASKVARTNTTRAVRLDEARVNVYVCDQPRSQS